MPRWKRMRATVLAIVACGIASGQDARPQQQPVSTEAGTEAIVGDWLGALTIGGGIKLRVVFHITRAAGGISATMDSPDQGVSGLPVSSAQITGKAVKLESAVAHGKFEGKISEDGNSMDGTWKQGPGSFPLLLKRVTDSSTLKPPARPQEPRKPYPYREEDVGYENKAAGNTLAGTLTIPTGKGPFPAVVLIPGSGPHDRDETIMGHKPFLVLADYLTRKGIAVLRYDDRGVGKSTGNLAGATSADLAGDAEAAFAYLKGRPEVDARRIGLIGHSEGGIIAPMIAARNHDVNFVVTLAGSGVPGDKVLVSQAQLVAEAGGMNQELAAKAGARQREILGLVKQSPDNTALKKALEEKFGGQVPDEQLDGLVAQLGSPWYRYFINYDPAPALRKVSCPVLALNGDKDTQVSSRENLPVIHAALEAGGNKNFETDELVGLNHLFQTAKTGAPKEYGEIEETISAAALEKISGWILKLGVRAGAD